MKKIPSAMKQAGYYALSLVMIKGSSLLVLPVVTRYLTPDEYGILDVILAFVNISTVVLGFGLVSAMYRFIALVKNADEQRKIVSDILGLTVIIAFTSGVAVQLIVTSVIDLFPSGVTELQLRLVMITLATEGLIGVPLAWIRFKDDAKLYFFVNCAKELSQLMLIYLALINNLSVTGMLMAGATSSVIFSIYLLHRQINEHGISIDVVNAKKYLTYGWPVVVSGISGFALVGLDRWMIASHLGTETLGVYAIAIKFSVIATFLLQPFTMWWFPKRFQVLQNQGRIEAARYAAMGVSISLIGVCSVATVAPLFIYYYLPLEYHGAIQYLPWLLMLSILKSIADLMNLGCYYQNTTTKQMYIQLICTSLAIVGFFLLIPKYHAYGAIYTLFFAQSVRVFLLYIVSQRIVWLPYPKLALSLMGLTTTILLYLSNEIVASIDVFITVLLLLAATFSFAFISGLLPKIKISNFQKV